MRRFFYILMIENLCCQICHYPNRLLVSIDLSQYKHETTLVQLFILCTQFCNNDHMTFCMYSVLYTFLNPSLILFDNKLSNLLLKNNINVSIPL